MTLEQEFKIAVRNCAGDMPKLAHYLYERCSEIYVDHRTESEKLFVACFNALTDVTP